MQFMKIVFQQEEEEEKNRNFLLISKRVEVCFGENHQQKLKISSSNLRSSKRISSFLKVRVCLSKSWRKKWDQRKSTVLILRELKTFPQACSRKGETNKFRVRQEESFPSVVLT